MYEVKVTYRFKASHFIKNYKGKSEKPHVHTWKVEVTIDSKKLDEAGLSVDFCKVKTLLEKTLKPFKNKLLNKSSVFKNKSVSTEVIAKYIFDALAPKINPKSSKITKVSVWETSDCLAAYIPKN
jgi:6-pyruvoyltetrahydropterin/6-carboxytetrahydropterin synthase